MTEMPGYPCAACNRQSRGISLNLPADFQAGTFHQFCSTECLVKFTHAPGPLTRDEEKAALEGGEAGGAYLDQIGKYDLRTLTGEEWARFCGSIYRGACDELRKQADDVVPF